MKKLMFLATVFSVVGFSGCTSWSEIRHGTTKPRPSFVALSNEQKVIKTDKDITETVNNPMSTLFVWSPEHNAAIANKDGQGCVQGADVFNTKEGKFNISENLFALLKKTALSDNSDTALNIEITNKLIQLKTNNERNTYFSMGMFGLCQLHANGGLSNTELLQLVGQLIETSAKIGTVGK